MQYAILTPWLLSRLLSAALVSYRALPPDQDSWIFDIALDSKSGADPGKAGEILRDSVEAIFASDDRTALMLPHEWPSSHPFKAQNSEEGGVVTVRRVLANGIAQGASHEDAGIQLADVVAHIVLSIVRGRPDEHDFAAWRQLRESMFLTDDRFPIKVWSWPEEAGSAEDEARYQRLLEP